MAPWCLAVEGFQLLSDSTALDCERTPLPRLDQDQFCVHAHMWIDARMHFDQRVHLPGLKHPDLNVITLRSSWPA